MMPLLLPTESTMVSKSVILTKIRDFMEVDFDVKIGWIILLRTDAKLGLFYSRG